MSALVSLTNNETILEDSLDGRLENYWGHATSYDTEFVAGSGQIISGGNSIFIEDQEEFTGINSGSGGVLDSILKAFGPTHSITLIADSLYLTELLQRIDPGKTREQIEEIYASASN